MNEYFVGGSLPELQIGYPAELNFHDFCVLLKQNLKESDYKQIEILRRFYDIQNIRLFWRGDEIDPRGNLNVNQLEDALLTQSELPDYIFTFIDSFDNNESRLHAFPQLVTQYFKEEQEQATPFLLSLLQFERNWRLVVSGFRAKKQKREIALELQYEDPYEELVAQMLAQKDAHSYEPPREYTDLKAVFEEHTNDPMELHKAICTWRFNHLEALWGVELFSLDRLLVYTLQLIIVEKWLELDRKQGLETALQLVKEAA